MIRFESSLMRQVGSEIGLPLSSVICQMFYGIAPPEKGSLLTCLFGLLLSCQLLFQGVQLDLYHFYLPLFIWCFPKNFHYLSASYLQLHLPAFALFAHIFTKILSCYAITVFQNACMYLGLNHIYNNHVLIDNSY